MIIFALVLSCLFIIGTYWNSYSNLVKQLGASQPPSQISVIIIDGNADRLSKESMAQLKTQLLHHSIDLVEIYDKYLNLKTTDKNSNKLVSSNSVQINPSFDTGSNKSVNGLYQNEVIYAEIHQCVGNESYYENQTFSKEGLTNASNLTETKENSAEQKPTPVVETRNNTQLIFKDVKNETTTVWKYLGYIGLHEKVYQLSKLILRYIRDPRTVSFIVIVSQAIAIFMYCYCWLRAQRAYRSSRCDEMVPKMEESLGKIVEKLHKVATLQETMCQHEHGRLTTYFQVVGAMHDRVQAIEEDLLKTGLKKEEQIMTLITQQNNILLQTLINVNRLKIKHRGTIKEERNYLKLLYEKDTFLLMEIVHKLGSADLVLDAYIIELETNLAPLENEEEKLEIHHEIESLKRDRINLQSFFQHPLFLELIIGDKAFVGKVPTLRAIDISQVDTKATSQ